MWHSTHCLSTLCSIRSVLQPNKCLSVRMRTPIYLPAASGLAAGTGQRAENQIPALPRSGFGILLSVKCSERGRRRPGSSRRTCECFLDIPPVTKGHLLDHNAPQRARSWKTHCSALTYQTHQNQPSLGSWWCPGDNQHTQGAINCCLSAINCYLSVCLFCAAALSPSQPALGRGCGADCHLGRCWR